MSIITIPKAPHQYPRRVLLAVCGLSPQIVTETIYALATSAGQNAALISKGLRSKNSDTKMCGSGLVTWR
jgi:hypothetical protein